MSEMTIKIEDIKIGDRFGTDWVVTDTPLTDDREIMVKVRYLEDGGTGRRSFNIGHEIKITRNELLR